MTTIHELLNQIRTILDQVDAALGVNPGSRKPTPERLANAVWAAAQPARKRGRPKGSKNKPKE